MVPGGPKRSATVRVVALAFAFAAMGLVALTSCTVGSSVAARTSPRAGASASASPTASPPPLGDPNVSTCGNVGIFARLPNGDRMTLGSCTGVLMRDAGEPVVIHVGESVRFISSQRSFDDSVSSDDPTVVAVRDNVATGVSPGLIGIHSDDTGLPCDGPDGRFTVDVSYCTLVTIKVEPDYFDRPR